MASLRFGMLLAVCGWFAALPATAEPPLTLQTQIQMHMGDLDMMQRRRIVRVLVPYSKTFYFLSANTTQRGMMVDLMLALEKQLNQHHKNPADKIRLVFIPTARDRLIPELLAGRGDIIAADLTITPQRRALVDFSTPLARQVHEVVVRHRHAPAVTSLTELAGKAVFVNPTSSYYQSLEQLNRTLKQQRHPPVEIQRAPGNFEPEDVLEMLNAGLVDYSVTDRYLALFWQQIFADIVIEPQLFLHQDRQIALAMRKHSPLLKAQLDLFCERHKIGSTFGNMQLKKYLKSTQWVKNATQHDEMQKFIQVRDLFHKYGNQYGIDWLLMVAQGYQESRLDQRVRSKTGAIGVMQVMPATGRELNVGDIRQLEPNINAGIKYIRFMMDRYYADQPMTHLDKLLFTFASYNAGPRRIALLRKEAARLGLDHNVWFNNVERVAAARIGRETVQYVSNIYKYYVAYALIQQQTRLRQTALQAEAPAGPVVIQSPR